jgi:hypothetical protein
LLTIGGTQRSARQTEDAWTNVRAFTDEVSQARIWAGFHYRFSTRVGQEMGRKIGQYVAANVMQPEAVAKAHRRLACLGLGRPTEAHSQGDCRLLAVVLN